MSLRENISKTFTGIRTEYKKVEMADKILDLISILGMALFVIALISMNISNKINSINITFTVYPLAIAGISAALRMKRRDEQKTPPRKLFVEWVTITSGITFIALLVVIISVIIY